MPRSKLAAFKQQLREAEDDVLVKTQQLEELKQQVSQARVHIQRLEGEVNSNATLEDDVQALLRHQQETASAFMDYENRVLALELQGLVDRWRTLDVEEISQQNHDLRQECMRLQQENMELSRAMAESSLSARRDLAKIEMALELTVKEKMREMHDRLRNELYDEMDDKTKKMVSEHGLLQDFVRDQATQAATLDRHCRMLQADRNRLKVDTDVATSLSEQQATQAVALRRQLKQAYQMVESLQQRLAESEARAQAAWDEAVRASSRAAVAAAAAARAGLQVGQPPDVDGDSAYGMAGEGAELAALESQLRHARQRFERMRLQRDRWRDRSLLYEKACAQLQAALHTLQDQARMTLPGGVKQDLDAIWCAAKSASSSNPNLNSTAADGESYGSRPSTAQLSSGASTPQSGVGGAGGFGGGADLGSPHGSPNGGWAAGGGAMAAGRARARAASARMAPPAGSSVRRSTATAPLPARPQTALPLGAVGSGFGSTGGGLAAKRAAEAIRAAVNMPGAPLPLPTPQAASHVILNPAAGQDEGGGAGVGAERTGAAAVASAWAEDEELQARGSVSPPGRTPTSRLYSSEAEPYRVVPRIQYDQTGWPVVPEIRSISPNRTGSGLAAGGRPGTALAPPPSTTGSPSPFTAGAGTPPGALRRAPGSMRPHSATPTEASAPPGPRWTPGKSLTGLTAPAVDGPGGGSDAAAAADTSAEARKGGEVSNGQPLGSQPQQYHQLQAQLRRQASSGHGAEGGGPGSGAPAGMAPSSVGAARTAHQAAEADWQAWQAQRERSTSPELAAIARSAAAAASAAAADSGVGVKMYGTLGLRDAGGELAAGERPAAVWAGSGAVPEVGMNGGAIYTVVHAISAAAGDGGAAIAAPPPAALASTPTLPGLRPHGGGPMGPGATATPSPSYAAAAAAAAATFRQPHLQMHLSGPPPPVPNPVPNPSAMLSALRRPSSNTSFKRLHKPDVLFSGARAASARGGRGGGGGGGGAGAPPRGGGLSTVHSVGSGDGGGAGGGGGGGARASSTGSMSVGL